MDETGATAEITAQWKRRKRQDSAEFARWEKVLKDEGLSTSRAMVFGFESNDIGPGYSVTRPLGPLSTRRPRPKKLKRGPLRLHGRCHEVGCSNLVEGYRKSKTYCAEHSTPAAKQKRYRMSKPKSRRPHD